MLILSNEDIERILTMPACMDVLREMYCDFAEGKTLTMPRVDNIAPSDHPDAYYAFKQMGGVWPRHHMVALRLNSDVVTHPTIGTSARRVKVPRANGRWVGLVELFSTETGELLAIYPDGVAQRMRVGATSGLGIEHLARKDVRRAGMIGSGWQAGAQLMALLAARPSIEQIQVYSTRKENCLAFIEWARSSIATNITIRAVDSAEECARDVDILLSATSSLSPIVQPEWLKPGMHLGCIKVQEVNQAILDRCDRVGVHNKIQINQTDNILPGAAYLPEQVRQGWWNQSSHWESYTGLSEMIVGRKTGRIDDKEITCFVNNTGLGLQFAALGTLILDQARKRGIGTELPSEWFSETVHP